MSLQATGRGGRRFRDDLPQPGALEISRAQPGHARQPFRPLPPPTGAAPYHLDLADVLSADAIAAIERAGRIAFHVIGDVGGIKRPEDQVIVATKMEEDFHRAGQASTPSFLYLLGDVVYYWGEAEQYYPQFYEPYVHYPAPIFAVPGNHDGDMHDDTVPSLAAFVDNFCATRPHRTRDAGDVPRDAMTQPNVYWTLVAPFVTIIGLYTNVPEGGELDADQIVWLEEELRTAPADRALLVAMHHPVYSADTLHSGSAYMATVLDDAIRRTGRSPDVALAGHVHDYQRFTRTVGDRQVPYIVAGAGGYWHLHKVGPAQAAPIPLPLRVSSTDVRLESYSDDRHGFLRLEVSANTVKGDYYTVPRSQERWRAPVRHFDSFTLDLQQHRLRP